DKEATRLIAEDYLKIFKDEGVDTLVLGCTHFPLLKKVIRDVLGKNVNLVDAGRGIANVLVRYLAENDAETDRLSHGDVKYYITDNSNFSDIAKIFFNSNVTKRRLD
ncbi:glutamate racemase, partial [Treponema sp. R6D11]